MTRKVADSMGRNVFMMNICRKQPEKLMCFMLNQKISRTCQNHYSQKLCIHSHPRVPNPGKPSDGFNHPYPQTTAPKSQPGQFPNFKHLLCASQSSESHLCQFLSIYWPHFFCCLKMFTSSLPSLDLQNSYSNSSWTHLPT